MSTGQPRSSSTTSASGMLIKQAAPLAAPVPQQGAQLFHPAQHLEKRPVLLPQGPVFFRQQPMHQQVSEAGVVADYGPGELEAFPPALCGRSPG